MKKTAGYSIVEALLMCGILIVVFLAFGQGVGALLDMSRTTLVGVSAERSVFEVAESIKSGVEKYQLNFAMIKGGANPEREEVLDIDKLTMAWDLNKTCLIGDDGCPDSLPGRYGYLIQPFDEFRGLFKVTVRMTHEKWKLNGEKYRDFVFVVSAK